mmetsp:Transcript_19680/g.78320  ORF Transcript_19680/g.78320 Transcript_19680/m.78320 type:complete len:210 (+) Transcript_19680:679-1308(+)
MQERRRGGGVARGVVGDHAGLPDDDGAPEDDAVRRFELPKAVRHRHGHLRLLLDVGVAARVPAELRAARRPAAVGPVDERQSRRRRCGGERNRGQGRRQDAPRARVHVALRRGRAQGVRCLLPPHRADAAPEASPPREGHARKRRPGGVPHDRDDVGEGRRWRDFRAGRRHERPRVVGYRDVLEIDDGESCSASSSTRECALRSSSSES